MWRDGNLHQKRAWTSNKRSHPWRGLSSCYHSVPYHPNCCWSLPKLQSSTQGDDNPRLCDNHWKTVPFSFSIGQPLPSWFEDWRHALSLRSETGRQICNCSKSSCNGHWHSHRMSNEESALWILIRAAVAIPKQFRAGFSLESEFMRKVVNSCRVLTMRLRCLLLASSVTTYFVRTRNFTDWHLSCTPSPLSPFSSRPKENKRIQKRINSLRRTTRLTKLFIFCCQPFPQLASSAAWGLHLHPLIFH